MQRTFPKILQAKLIGKKAARKRHLAKELMNEKMDFSDLNLTVSLELETH